MTPTPHVNPEIAALEAQWWKDWWTADYSWDGLSSELKVFWAGEERHLIAEPGTSRRWTRAHCPLIFADGTPSPKARWTEVQWQTLRDAIPAQPTLNLSGTVGVLGYQLPSAVGKIQAHQAYVVELTLSGVDVDLSASWIAGNVVLTRPIETLACDGAVFAGKVSLTRTRLGSASFSKAWFLADVNLRFSDFPTGGNFSGASFAAGSDFSEVVFGHHADFSGARFGGVADFFGVRFLGRALFDEVECLDNIGFYKAAFVRRLTLNDARLYGRLNLEGATDGDPISQSAQAIHLTVAGQPADGQPVKDLNGSLEPSAGPPERSFKSLPKLHARRTQFYEDANFSNRDLLSPSTFRDSVFHEKAEFHGSDIHASVNLYGTDFRRALSYKAGSLPHYPEALLKLRFAGEAAADEYRTWKKVYLRSRVERRKDDFISDNYYNNLEASFRTLKQLMEERRDRLKEGEFFNLELRARRKRKDIPLWERVISVLYWVVSDYGNSIFRPMLMLLLLFIAMASAYYVIGQVRGGPSPMVPDAHGLFSALVFSLQNVFAPFSVLDASKFNAADTWVARVVLPADPAQSLTIKLLASTQSLLSLTLAFLAGLAGRRRFQIN